MALNPMLRMAVLAGVEVAIKVHVRRGDDLNARDGAGLTPLMIAASRNKAAVISLLLSYGADPTLVDARGNSAEEIASHTGAIECVSLLREATRAWAQTNGETADVPKSPLSGMPEQGEHPEEIASHSGIPTSDDATTIAISTIAGGQKGELDYWEAEPELVAPAGDSTILSHAKALHDSMNQHVVIDSSESWADFAVSLPEHAVPLVPDDSSGLDLLFLLAYREGSVPEFLLSSTCYERSVTLLAEVDSRSSFVRNAHELPYEERAALVSQQQEVLTKAVGTVICDIGAGIDERSELDKSAHQVPADVDESIAVSDAFTYLEGLLSDRNDPYWHYFRELRRHALLDPEEELTLARTIEESNQQALDCLSLWPDGITMLLETASLVANGEADPEQFSSGTEPTDNGPDLESGHQDTSPAEDTGEEDLDTAAISYLSAMAKLQASVSSSTDSVKAALVAAKLTRSCLLTLANTIDTSAPSQEFRRALARQESAREKMIVSNLRLVITHARKYQGFGLPLDDLIQEGNIGLMKAVERFDWRKGYRFSTYATWWIRQQITRSIADKGRTIRIPVHLLEQLRKVTRELATATSAPSPSNIATKLRMSPGKAARLLMLLDEPASFHEENDQGCALIHTLASDPASDPYTVVEMASLHSTLLHLLDDLTKQQREVIKLRFGLCEDEATMTLEEVGARFGVTRERIRQIESKALGKLSHSSRREILAPYMGDGPGRPAVLEQTTSKDSTEPPEQNLVGDSESIPVQTELDLGHL